MTDASAPRLKPNWRRLQALYRDDRSAEQITEHYLVERGLAARLRDASAEDRSSLYGALYGELFARLPHHPRFRRARDATHAEKQLATLKRLVQPGASFLEVGAGDCAVTIGMASYCREAVAVDVTRPDVIAQPAPPNFRFEFTDGTSMPAPDASVDFVYSHQLMEHLHPDDALRQLREICRILRPGGSYFCITPSKVTGPHDISRFFSDEAQGFHLKEYTYRDLSRLFAETGFDRMRACITRGGYYAGAVPVRLLISVEAAFARLPISLRSRLSTSRSIRAVLGLALLGHKTHLLGSFPGSLGGRIGECGT